MFRIERQQEILNYVNEHQTAKNQEMARYFHTCLATIRNDINELALRGLLVKTHGGAVCLQHISNKEIPSIVRFQQNIESKQAIASIAANMVEDGDVIILDSGSTTHEIATRLKASNVTVVTNDLRIALTLAEQGNANVIVAGGTLMASVYTLVGSETIDFLKNIKVHKLFLGCDAIDFNSGITNRTFDESHVKHAMIAAAKEVIAVADCSKFHRQVFARVCELSALDALITDQIEPEDREKLAAVSVRVITPQAKGKAKNKKNEE